MNFIKDINSLAFYIKFYYYKIMNLKYLSLFFVLCLASCVTVKITAPEGSGMPFIGDTPTPTPTNTPNPEPTPVDEESAKQIRMFKILNGEIPEDTNYLVCHGQYIPYQKKIDYLDYFKILASDNNWYLVKKTDCEKK
jgi:hypothetical protein